MPPALKGFISLLFIVVATVLCCVPIYVLAIIRFVAPRAWETPLSRFIDGIPNFWLGVQVFMSKYWLKVQWHVTAPPDLNPNQWYLLISNHQTWVDPFAIAAGVGSPQIPVTKFFAKQEVLWIPFVNLATYAIHCPMLKRYPKQALEKNPTLRLKDMETTLKSCRKLAEYPNTIATFAEGTRWTPKKYLKQHPPSPFQYLLRPKVGGIAYAIQALGDKITDSILDVTVLFPTRTPTFWAYLCGLVPEATVIVKKRSLPQALRQGDYATDPAFREAFKQWLYTLWDEKDALLREYYTKKWPCCMNGHVSTSSRTL